MSRIEFGEWAEDMVTVILKRIVEMKWLLSVYVHQMKWNNIKDKLLEIAQTVPPIFTMIFQQYFT